MCNNIIQGHAGGKRKKKDKSVNILPPVGPAMRLVFIEGVVADLIHQVLGDVQSSGGRKALGKPTEHNIYWVYIHAGSGGNAHIPPLRHKLHTG